MCGASHAHSSLVTGPFRFLQEKTIEAHILHDFGRDFYGEKIKLMITGYIRAMTAFPSIDDLIKAIENDCEITREELDSVEMKVRSILGAIIHV